MKDMNWPERVAYLENQLADSDRENQRLSEFIKGLPDGDETPAQLAEAQRFRRSTMYWHERAMKAEARLAEAERDADQLLKERDHAEGMADKLADALATMLCVDIGEHSSDNCPWTEALEAFEERATHGLSQLQHESEELGLYQMTHATRVCYVCQRPLEPDDIAASCINGGPRHRKAVNSLRVYSPTTEGGPCRTCGGSGAIDAPTSADDPSCPDCDGEGVRR